MKKRIITLTLLVTVLLTQFIACEKKAHETDTQSTQSVTEAEYLQKADYNNYEFKILGREVDKSYLISENSESSLEESIFKMNCAVSDRYHITFSYLTAAAETMDEVSTAYQSGDDIYDVVTTHAKHAFSLVGKNLALDWNTDLPYVNLDKEWWPSSAADEFTVGGHLYTMCGDISYMSLARTKCLYFNKNVFDQYGKEYPYDTVKNNEWTFEKMTEYALTMYSDVDGGGMNIEKDNYGYVTNWWGTPINILCTAGIHAFSKDSNGMLTLDIYSDRTIDIFDKFFAFADNESVYLALADAGDFDIQAPFTQGRATFIEFTMETAALFGGDMKNDFGILPCPKYDESVNDYMTLVDASTGLFIVPVLASDVDRTSIILEAMAYYGNEHVIPQFYDRTLSGQAVRDEASIEMLKIIRSARTFDVAYFSGVSIFAYTGYHLCKNDNNFSSLYSNNEMVAKTLIQQLNNAFS